MVAQKNLKSSNNYPYFISPIDETTEKHVFLPQKGPYLPNRPNRKRAWDSVTRRVWVYREKFNIDFWFQKFFLTSQHILGLPKKIWEKNPMLNFSGWPRKLGSPLNWDSQKWSNMRLREGVNWKKTFSFGHCPNHLTPPPMTPIRATWSFFFGRQKRRFNAYYRTK